VALISLSAVSLSLSLSLSLSSGAGWWSQVNLLPTGGPASYGGLEALARL
jgi:hypothetical protein